MRRSVEEGAALDEPGLAAALDIARAARRRVDAGAEERRRPRVEGRAELRGAPAGRGAVGARAGSKRQTGRLARPYPLRTPCATRQALQRRLSDQSLTMQQS